MSEEEKIVMVLEWAEENPNFDISFIESIAEALAEYGSLTYYQGKALDNIIRKFRINP